jgi:hypothetical protein
MIKLTQVKLEEYVGAEAGLCECHGLTGLQPLVLDQFRVIGGVEFVLHSLFGLSCSVFVLKNCAF